MPAETTSSKYINGRIMRGRVVEHHHTHHSFLVESYAQWVKMPAGKELPRVGSYVTVQTDNMGFASGIRVRGPLRERMIRNQQEVMP